MKVRHIKRRLNRTTRILSLRIPKDLAVWLKLRMLDCRIDHLLKDYLKEQT